MARARHPHPAAHPLAEPPRRSHAAMPLAVAFLFVGLLLGSYTVVVPAILGVVLLLTALSFLSSRLNPFSLGYYLTIKPSWPTIGLLFLASVVLFGAAWGYYVTGFAPVVP